MVKPPTPYQWIPNYTRLNRRITPDELVTAFRLAKQAG